MEEFFPSEIARLVLGFLKAKNCEKSFTTFLEECSDLEEYCSLYKKGKFYPTNINGKSLLEILSEYSILKRKEAINKSEFKEKFEDVLKETLTIALEHQFQKYFFGSSSDNHHKDHSSIDAALSVHTSDREVDNCIELVNKIEMSDESHEALKEIEICTHKTESKGKLGATNYNNDHSTEQSTLIKISKVSAVNHDLQLVEPLMSDEIYMHDIIKVEKDSEIPSILENKSKKNVSYNARSLDISSDSTKNNLNAVSENQRKTLFKTSSHKVITEEYAEPIKIEPDCSDECNLIKTDKSKNGIQNNTSVSYAKKNSCNAFEISHIASCNTQSIKGLTQGSIGPVNNINSLNNQSGYAIETTPFSSQPVAVNDMSFSSVPTYIVQNYSPDNYFLQNNSQYSFVINTPNTWKGAAGSFPLTISNINSNNIGPVLTSVESLKSNITPLTPPVSDKNLLSPILTPINQDPIGSRNTPSVTNMSANASINNIDIGGELSQIDLALSSVCSAAKTLLAAKNQKLKTSKSPTSKSKKKSTNKQESGKKTEDKEKKS